MPGNNCCRCSRSLRILRGVSVCCILILTLARVSFAQSLPDDPRLKKDDLLTALRRGVYLGCIADKIETMGVVTSEFRTERWPSPGFEQVGHVSILQVLSGKYNTLDPNVRTELDHAGASEGLIMEIDAAAQDLPDGVRSPWISEELSYGAITNLYDLVFSYKRLLLMLSVLALSVLLGLVAWALGKSSKGSLPTIDGQ